MERSATLVAGLVVGVVVATDTVRTEVLASQIDEFATYLDCSETEEMPD